MTRTPSRQPSVHGVPLSLNEIRSRALAFAKEWAGETSEDAESKSFWDAFFHVFGISRRRVATFEEPVRRTDGRGGFIDLLWRGKLIVEHKSRGRDLAKAYIQAKDYFDGLKERDLPQYVLVSDFARFRLYDLDQDSARPQVEFSIDELHLNIKHFGFISGYESRTFEKEDPVNVHAATKLGALHDELKRAGYQGHELEVFLVRVLFCLFADDTNIFAAGQFREYLEQRTQEDGSDLGGKLTELFQTLNTSPDRRQKTLDEQLASFPYVNGLLFAEILPTTAFTGDMREALLESSALDWSRISPAIFGSLFQSIMDKQARRDLGAHYTREANILKALRPLFLDSLREEFEKIKGDPRRLPQFHKKLSEIRVFDPACGCGNFLVIAYRELRILELEVLRSLQSGRRSGTLSFDLAHIVSVDVDQFYGIEIEEFPAQIAQVALWLTDHQMNMLVSEEFGEYFVRLPLRKAPNIVHANALLTKWEDVISPKLLSYIVGNPPFVGKAFQSAGQKAELTGVFHDVKGAGVLDYVACWYRKAADFMAANRAIECAFVSTNSITQGEQVGVLWKSLLARGVRINFAHRTFEWTSEAKGKAAVHCVVIGFALRDRGSKRLSDYENVRAEPVETKAGNINPYLVDAADVVLVSRTRPICNVPEMAYGSMPNDDGFLLFKANERDEFLRLEPRAEPYIRPFLGSEEFISHSPRYCLWLKDVQPNILRSLPEVMRRVASVREVRESSTRPATRALGNRPTLFGEDRQPTTRYLAVPKTSSESRKYIPIGFLEPSTIASTELFTISEASEFHFGVLTSLMHMSWVRAVCGRLKSDYRYSAGIVYNNFPWPSPSHEQRAAIVSAALAVLAARAEYAGSNFADLYHPVAMPDGLRKVHMSLDRAVEIAYGKRDFRTEAERVAHLFGLYEQIANPMTSAMRPSPRRRRAPL